MAVVAARRSQPQQSRPHHPRDSMGAAETTSSLEGDGAHHHLLPDRSCTAMMVQLVAVGEEVRL